MRILQVLFKLSHGGAERLALTILDGTRQRVEGIVCGVFDTGGPLEDVIDKMALPHISIDAQRKGKLKSWIELYRLIKKENIDIVHIQSAYLLLYAFIPAKLAGAAVVYTEHSKYYIETTPILPNVIRIFAPFISKITTVSRDLQFFFMDYLGQPERRLTVIPNGVDATLFTPHGPSERGMGIPNDGRLVFGTVARMTEAKDHDNLLRAFQKVRSTRQDVLLALVGDGETRDHVEQMVVDLGLSDAVLLLGRKDDIPSWLRAMDIFVLPSQREGAPISILEAMSCGIPVVATNVGGVSEILVDGENGRVVPPNNHESLAEAMLWMAENPEGRSRLAEAGLEAIVARFSHCSMCRRYLELYDGVMSRRAAKRLG